KKSVLTMASIAAENLNNSVKGLLERNEDLLNDAIAEDEEVNAYERSIDKEGMEILMRFNPVATDLRTVVSAMKVSTNLERIADQAENIARRARKILKQPEVAETRMIEPVFEKADELLRDAIRSYSEGDVELALGLHRRDQKLDKIHRKTIKTLTKAMESDTDNLKIYLNLIFIVRCLERVGDHAVNIGEDAVYVEEAADIRHVGPAALEGEEEEE
ncbi:MAG: phosphate signaling complex protein PhoU, partial [Verrucomicrobiales bacterium]|nr:phosphate signaling complex protein PhoU [Verrucomicrobiales bacterium]